MNRLIIAGAAGCVVAAAAMYVFVLPLVRGGAGHPAAAPAAVAATPTPVPAIGMVYSLPERILNLAPSDGVPHYARIELALEFRRPAGVAPFKPKAPAASATPLDPALTPVHDRDVQIEDAVVRVVGSKTLDALVTNDGKDALKRELMAAVNQIVGTPEVTAVYILQLVAQ